MPQTNLHTHSNFYDGAAPLEAYIQKAIALKMKGIGFSSHAPIGFPSSWHMKASRF